VARGFAAVDRFAVEAFILAGGRSQRMGTDKARLALDGSPLAVILARRIAPVVARVRLVTKPGEDYDEFGLECVHDVEPERALVHGIRAALAAPGAPWRWMLACDMPKVGGDVLAELWKTARAAAAPGSAPRLAGRIDPEPLPSLWHRDLGAEVRPEWGNAARDWVAAARLALWEVPAAGEDRFRNVNTPADWQAYLAARPGGMG